MPAAAPAAESRADAHFLRRLLDWLDAGSRTRWLIAGLLLTTALPWFFSCPLFPEHPEARVYWSGYWSDIVGRKVADPLYDYGRHFPAERNEAKRTFRLVVPLAATLTHSGMTGVHVTRFALQAVLLVALLLAAERAWGGDRLAALGLALAVAGTTVGTAVWRDACYWFDNCAYAFLALALLARGPWVAGSAILLGAFVDERVLLAMPLVAVYHLGLRSPRSVAAALALAVPAYLAIRLGLTHLFGLTTSLGGIALSSILTTNLPSAPAAFWFSLEGGWLIVGLAAWRLGLDRRAAALLGCAALVLVAAGCVEDFTRSASYAFPAVLAAAAWLTQGATPAGAKVGLRRWTGWAAAVSILVPNAMILGTGVQFESSLPVRALLAWLRTLG